MTGTDTLELKNIDPDDIKPATDLQELYPGRDRRRKIKELQYLLGIPVDILGTKKWLRAVILIGIAVSLGMFFFRWQIALCGLVLFNIIGWVAKKFFAGRFELSTVGQLTEKLTREYYRKSRRNGSTINRVEVAQTIKDLFQHNLDWACLTLTRESTFD